MCIFICEVWQKVDCISPNTDVEQDLGRAAWRPPNPAVPKPVEHQYDSKRPLRSVLIQ